MIRGEDGSVSVAPATHEDSVMLAEVTGEDSEASESQDDESSVSQSGVSGTSNTGEISHEATFPPNAGQTQHIMGDRLGHLTDTPENRQRLLDAVSEENYSGTNEWGSQEYNKTNEDGTQT